MKRVWIALKNTESFLDTKGDWIGADRGAYHLAQNGIRMRCAVGDFDSVSAQEMECIRAYSDEVICLNPIKDDSDSEHAVQLALSYGYEEIVLVCPFGGRMDHSYVNLKLAFRHPGVLKLMDEQNLVYALGPGKHAIAKNGYAYISFFVQERAEISLDGFAYPLDHRTIVPSDLYTVSNEIVAETGLLEVHEGIVLVMQCKD